MHRTVPTEKNYLIKMPVVQRLKNPVVGLKRFNPILYGDSVSMEEVGLRSRTGHQDSLLQKDFAHFWRLMLSETHAALFYKMSLDARQTVPWPERAIGPTPSAVSYLHQACCQTLRIGRHLWQEISQD